MDEAAQGKMGEVGYRGNGAEGSAHTIDILVLSTPGLHTYVLQPGYDRIVMEFSSPSGPWRGIVIYPNHPDSPYKVGFEFDIDVQVGHSVEIHQHASGK